MHYGINRYSCRGVTQLKELGKVEIVSVYLETKVKAKETCGFLEMTVDVGKEKRLAAFLLLPREPEPLSI